MRALVIDDNTRHQLSSLAEYAESNPFSFDELLDVKNKAIMPAGDMEEFTRFIPDGYKVVYSIENQPVGTVRHLSVSVNRRGKLPSTHSVIEIMKLIGFQNIIERCKVGLEDISPGHQAVNVWEIK